MDRTLANPLQQLAKADSGDFSCLRQQTGCGHPRQRVRLETPEATDPIAPEIDRL
jgi:hypothetical protein